MDVLVKSVVKFLYYEKKAWDNGYPIKEPEVLSEGPEREKIWAAQRAKYDKVKELPWIPYLKATAKPIMIIYIGLIHILGGIGLTKIPYAMPQTLLWAVFLYLLNGQGITAGCHRLWSHRSYEGSNTYRFFMMICASIANQGSIWHWCRDHRVHHKTSETSADPHNALRGFFYSHVGWLLVKKDPRVFQFGTSVDMSDLSDMWEVRFNKHMGAPWNLFWCFAMPTLVAKYFWGESMFTAFLVAGVVRYLVALHFTWCVNSVAHLFGDHPYEDINPAESPFVTLGSLGEGWHNYHHAFPFDYAASELGVSEQFNPTKLIIDIAAKFGMVWNRRRATDLWEMRKKKLASGEAIEEKVVGPPLFKHRVVEYGESKETRLYENQTFLKLQASNQADIVKESRESSETKSISEQELAKHNTALDSWIVINGKVYDTTKFKATHPGGEEVIQLYAGKANNGATEAFEMTGHSKSAKAMLNKLYVGDLVSCKKTM